MASSSAWTSTRSQRPRRRALVAVTSALAFVAFLDVTVVNVAFADIKRSFGGSDMTALSWTVTAYGAALAALLIPAGRLGDALGQRSVLVAGGSLFVAASAVCAVAASPAALIAARGVQGIAAALVTPASFGLLLSETSGRDRARAISIWGAAATASALVGPTFGGLLVEAGGWRTLFAVNIPVGLLLVGCLVWLVPRRRIERGPLPDAVGTLLVAIAVALLVISTTNAGAWGWNDSRTLSTAGLGALAAGLALLRARRSRTPAVNLDLMGRRGFALANAVSLVFGFAVFAWLLAAPLFAVSVWRYDALTAALSVAPGAVTAAGAALLAGRLPARGRGVAIVGGSTLFAATVLSLALTLGDAPEFLSLWLPVGVLSGLAVGGVLAGLSTTVAFSLPAESFAGGAGINMTVRQLGGTLGVALLAALVGTGGNRDAGEFTVVWIVGAVAGLIAAAGGVALLRVGEARAVGSG